MRVNVYAEELRGTMDAHGDRITRVDKQVVKSLPNKHHALQILLGERDIHSDNQGGIDDDTPGIKFWYYTENDRKMLVAIFEKALLKLAKPEARGE